ncbi:MAG: hypothetical protein KDD78_17785, partial [Caldilineaceae bacterium]|nr:hypothetical protein [Caldilineaceae bacterium]
NMHKREDGAGHDQQKHGYESATTLNHNIRSPGLNPFAHCAAFAPLSGNKVETKQDDMPGTNSLAGHVILGIMLYRCPWTHSGCMSQSIGPALSTIRTCAQF